jgi:integrase
MLCRRAGVPDADVRGNITSHRARSTIASQLYNAKEPMTLFELQPWPGHHSVQSTLYYAKITPNASTAGGTQHIVVVGHRRGLALLDRQRGLGAVQCLHRGFLVQAQHERIVRRRSVICPAKVCFRH